MNENEIGGDDLVDFDDELSFLMSGNCALKDEESRHTDALYRKSMPYMS